MTGLYRGMKSGLCVSSLIVLAALALTAPANGYVHIKLRFLGKPASRLYADGNRWAAYEPSSGITRIIDARTGTESERSNPEGCADGLNEGLGQLVGSGSGYLLYDCGNSPMRPLQRYVVDRIEDGAYHVVTVSLPASDPVADTYFSDVGRQWLAGTTFGYRFVYPVFLNWHTGKLVEDGAFSDAAEVENLNRAGLWQPLCNPLRRIPNPTELNFFESPRFTSFLYAPPFAVADEAVRSGSDVVGTSAKPIRLMRCGTHAYRKLPGWGASMQVGSGRLTWIALGRNKPVAYVTRLDAHRRRWHDAIIALDAPAGSAGPDAQNWLLQHTARTIFLSVISRPDEAVSLYAAAADRLPS
jgi:hypothetical protein